MQRPFKELCNNPTVGKHVPTSKLVFESNVLTTKNFPYVCHFVSVLSRFVFLVLFHLDIELHEPEAQVPEADVSRYGFGMLQPNKELQIRFKRRDLPCFL